MHYYRISQETSILLQSLFIQSALPPKIFYNDNSFNLATTNIAKFHFKIPGQLLNTNKIESFKKLDKKQLLHENAMQIVNDIRNKKCIEDPSLLYRFFIISFADLKKHKYVYWCCYPTILSKNFKIINNSSPTNLIINLITKLIRYHH